MNYYPHHIGDFNNATRHLSRIERSVYRDLLDLYYDTESPLTLDFNGLCRLIIARSDEERTAVEQVLNEYFNKTEHGYSHSRCDDEIEKFHANIAAKSAAGRASAAKRAGKTQKSQHQLNDKQTAVEQPLNRCSSGAENPLTLRSTNQNQNQNQNQEPIKETTLSGKPDAAPPKPDPSTTAAKEAVEYLNHKTGAQYRAVESNLKLVRARMGEGATLDEIKAVIDLKTREWAGTDSAKYLRPETLFNATKYNQYAGQIGGMRQAAAKPRGLVL